MRACQSVSPPLSSWSFGAMSSLSREDLDELRGKIIVFSGIPGAGKSTCIRSLVTYINKTYYDGEVIAVALEEDYDWNCMNVFYEDPNRYASTWEAMVIRDTSRKMELANEMQKEGKIVLVERGVHDVLRFMEIMLDEHMISELEFEILYEYIDVIQSSGIALEVYLEVSPEVAVQRIQERLRRAESQFMSVNIDYLQKLDSMRTGPRIDLYRPQKCTVIEGGYQGDNLVMIQRILNFI